MHKLNLHKTPNTSYSVPASTSQSSLVNGATTSSSSEKQSSDLLLGKQAGFTIVELMIATMVFSVILMVITVGVMYFTRNYYKGVYASMTQNAARDISDAVAQAVQFGSDDPIEYKYGSTTNNYFCAGGYVFVFKLGEQYIVNSGTTGMYMQPMSGNCDNSVLHPSSTALAQRRQLLGDRMRVTYLNFEGANGLYTFDVRVAYGDDDLLSDNTGLGSDLQCNLGSGREYCAVAQYTSSVRQRKT